jgi:hypothetical protein
MDVTLSWLLCLIGFVQIKETWIEYECQQSNDVKKEYHLPIQICRRRVRGVSEPR